MHVTKRFHSEELELNMTPMIDIVFQLIIFFLVVSEIASYDRVENLTLPTASEVKPEPPMPDRLVISVNRDNQIIIDRRVLNIDGVEGYLRVEKKRGGTDDAVRRPVLIQGDKYCEWRIVQDIMERAAPLGFKRLSFSARKEEGG